MKNPKWHRDEIILALDLYFSPDRGSIDAKNPKIIALSKVLNSLPLIVDRPDKEKFRNPSGVTLKLSNFLSLDPAHNGKGMTSHSKLDKAVFNEFKDNKVLLHKLAEEIKLICKDDHLLQKLHEIEDDEVIQEDGVPEGATLYKLHKVRERDRQIVRRKKDHALAQYGSLVCEVCEFDFYRFYGEVGKGFIECHHRTPLSSIKMTTKTSLADLALVCANCHRMLHKNMEKNTVEHLKTLINNLPA